MKNIEFGVKGALADGTYYNLSYFMVDWDNPQLNTSTPVNGYMLLLTEIQLKYGFDVDSGLKLEQRMLVQIKMQDYALIPLSYMLDQEQKGSPHF